MTVGLEGSNAMGVSQLRRSDTVAPNPAELFPPSVERLHAPNCEHEYTRFWFVGSIRFVVPSPPPIAFHDGVPQDRREPLSWAPPLTRDGSWRDTATVENWLTGNEAALVHVPGTQPLDS